MDIRNWGLDEIMKLPDHLFGRRYEVSTYARGGNNNFGWDMSELAFPDVGVLWQVLMFPQHADSGWGYVRIGIGDQLPTTTAMMDTTEALIPAFGLTGPGPPQIRLPTMGTAVNIQTRRPISFQGRRLITEAYAMVGKYAYVHLIVVVSGLPKEVPDWSWWLRQKDFVGGRAGRS